MRTGPTGTFPFALSEVQGAVRRNIPLKAVIEVDEPGRLRWRIPHMTLGTWLGYTVELQMSEAAGATVVRSGGGIPNRGPQIVDGGNEVGRGARRIMRAAIAELGAGEVDYVWNVGLVIAAVVAFVVFAPLVVSLVIG